MSTLITRQVIKAVAAKHRVAARDIRAPHGPSNVRAARHEVIRTLASRGWSCGRIGLHLNRHHTTVLASLGRV